MRMSGLYRIGIAVALVAAAAVGAGAAAFAHGGEATAVHSCVSAQGTLRIVGPSDSCKARETALDWSVRGPQGIQGEQGEPGPSDPAVAVFVGRFASPGRTPLPARNAAADCYLGEVILTASRWLPENFTPADGRLLSINQWQALFNLLGTDYGGNGQTTFALPDMRPLAPDLMVYGICTAGVFPSVL